jgi:RimK family alpha-L-glutamate ligase
MRIVLVDYSPYGNRYDQVSNGRLARAAADAGHRLDLVPWARLRLVAESGRLAASARLDDGASLDLRTADVVIPRFDARDARDLALVLGTVRWIEACGIPCMSSAEAIAAAEDKVETARRLAAAGMPVPRSAVLPAAGRLDAGALDEAVAAVGGFPVVVKAPVGWGGHAVALADSRSVLSSWLDLAGQIAPNATYLLQAKIAHEITVHVVAADGQVVADGQKSLAAGEFRTNVRLGGREAPARLTPAERELALRALEVCAVLAGSVDLARGPDGTVILEVNACTGIAGDGDEPIAAAFVQAAAGVARRATLPAT